MENLFKKLLDASKDFLDNYHDDIGGLSQNKLRAVIKECEQQNKVIIVGAPEAHIHDVVHAFMHEAIDNRVILVQEHPTNAEILKKIKDSSVPEIKLERMSDDILKEPTRDKTQDKYRQRKHTKKL